MIVKKLLYMYIGSLCQVFIQHTGTQEIVTGKCTLPLETYGHIFLAYEYMY